MCVPHVSPFVVHSGFDLFPNVCTLVEVVVSFGVEVLLAEWAFELFVCFPYVHAETSKEGLNRKTVCLVVCCVCSVWGDQGVIDPSFRR